MNPINNWNHMLVSRGSNQVYSCPYRSRHNKGSVSATKFSTIADYSQNWQKMEALKYKKILSLDFFRGLEKRT